MDHQIFDILFILALIGHQLATAAPLTDNKQHHHSHHLAAESATKDEDNSRQHHRPGHQTAASTVKDIDNILRELDMDTTVLVAADDKLTEIYPEQRELPAEMLRQVEAGQQLELARKPGRVNRRRSRRSAALLLHATLRMCDIRPIRCNRILLQRDNVQISIRLVDE